MKAKGGKFITTARVFQGCYESKGCELCQMCLGYNRRLAKCKACYEWPVHCVCKDHQMDKVVQFMNNILDRPFRSENDGERGEVKVHQDPSERYRNIINNSEITRGGD